MLSGPHESKHVETVHVRHVEIEDHQGRWMQGDPFDSFKTVRCFVERRIPQCAKRCCYHSAHSRRVIYDQDPIHKVEILEYLPKSPYAYRDNTFPDGFVR